MDIYAGLSEKRWTSSKCQPNLTILIFTDQMIKYDSTAGRQEYFRRPRLFARYHQNKRAPNLRLEMVIDGLMREINNDNGSATGALKLDRFLSRFAQWYQFQEVTTTGGITDGMTQKVRPQHTIPMWAAVTFGVCSVLSVLAVLVGNFVTSSKITRRNKNNNGNRSKRKWGAGFSGGMWASV